MEKEVKMRKRLERKEEDFVKIIKLHIKKQKINRLFNHDIKKCDQLLKRYNKLFICVARMSIKMLLETIFKILRPSKPYK